MTVIGAGLAAICVAVAVVALRTPSRVERLLAAGRAGPSTRLRALAGVSDATLGAVGLDRRGDALVVTKLAACASAALLGCALALVLGAGPLPIVLCAYGGYVLPSIVVEHRAASARADADRATVVLVERLHALISAGRPIETAVLALAERRSGSALVDAVLEGTRREHLLGVPLHLALARHARAAGVAGLASLAERLEMARTLGRGAATILADARDELREAERRTRLAEASTVEGKLTLVLTLCYLPALALLVVIPLFLTLLSALSG